MQQGTIKSEHNLVASSFPPLDESELQLTEVETEFLRTAICGDEREMRRRILQVQKRAYTYFAYPCIRMFHFLCMFMRENPAYEKIVDAGRTGTTTFLDLGCCMGTDVRKLVVDGYPAVNVFGCDLRQEFIDCGYELYQDERTCGIRFIVADIFALPFPLDSLSAGPRELDASSAAAITKLEQLGGRIAHCHAGALFHLFDEYTQYVLALRLASLMRRSSGSIIFGRHQALREAGTIPSSEYPDRFGHSPESWRTLWRRVFAELESPEFAEEHVVVQAEVADNWGRGEIVRRSDHHSILLFWSVEIV